MTPAAPTTHGMPSWRAMIAVWLVAPPRSVTSAVTSAGSRPEVSLGARSSATRIDGSLGVGHARLGLADEVGDDAALDVAQVGDALGHQAAHGGEDRDELVDRALHGGDRALPGLHVLGDRAAQALVAGEPGARGEHLGRRALGGGRLGGEGVGDRAHRVVVRRQGGVGVGEVAVAEARDRVGRDLAADVEDGAGGDARHDRGAAQAVRVRDVVMDTP